MKSASCAWWIKQMRYRSADNRADNSKHHCPCDRQMCMHKRFRDTAREEPDNHMPDKTKHDFLRCIVRIWEINSLQYQAGQFKATQNYFYVNSKTQPGTLKQPT